MRQQIRLLGLILILAALVVPLTAHAAAVGHFTMVRGEVDVLRQGKLPAISAKVQDGVEMGDVIRTKTKAKAQLTMVDDSVITLAPESRLAVADFHYNPDKPERRAVLRAFRGLVHTVVKRIIKTEEPDFIMETHTAIIGVRGTEWYTALGPNFTLACLVHGDLGVRSNLAALPALSLVRSMHSIQIPLGKQPLPVQTLTQDTLRTLENLMDKGLGSEGLGGLSGAGQGGSSQTPLTLPGISDQKILQQTIPPVLPPQKQVPAPVQPPPTPVHPPTGGTITPGGTINTGGPN